MDCSNPPRDDTYMEGDKLPQVIYIDKVNRTCLVRVSPKKSVVAHMNKNIAEGIQLLDHVELRWSHISKEFQVTQYYVNQEVYSSIHNSYQTTLDVVDERGVPL